MMIKITQIKQKPGNKIQKNMAFGSNESKQLDILQRNLLTKKNINSEKTIKGVQP